MSNPKTEIERLHKWIEDLQAGKTVNCVYCGHAFAPDPVGNVPQAQVLRRHMVQCEHHPMHRLLLSAQRAEEYLTVLLSDRSEDLGLREILTELVAAIDAAMA